MKIIYKNSDWEYSREVLEYLLFQDNLHSNKESTISLVDYLNTDFGTCEFFKGGANVS